MKKQIRIVAATALFLSGCIIGAAVDVVGETVDTGVGIAGAATKTTIGVAGTLVGGTVDMVVPGDRSKDNTQDQ